MYVKATGADRLHGYSVRPSDAAPSWAQWAALPGTFARSEAQHRSWTCDSKKLLSAHELAVDHIKTERRPNPRRSQVSGKYSKILSPHGIDQGHGGSKHKLVLHSIGEHLS